MFPEYVELACNMKVYFVTGIIIGFYITNEKLIQIM